MLPVPGDFMMPRFVSSRRERMVSWNVLSDSPFRVVIPMASGEVCVRTYVSGVAIYRPSKMPLTAANSSVYFWALARSRGSSGCSRSSRTSPPRAKAAM